MDIKNIALVRATNVIPFDGIVRPVSNERHFEKGNASKNLRINSEIEKLLEKKGEIPPIDYSKYSEEYLEEREELVNQVMKDYVPYSFNYNSMELFALNGIVPDDSEAGFGNNIFSNKTCAIIDGLEEHLDETISLVPTDTALKGKENGNIRLSKNAAILIQKERYEGLTTEEKQQLECLDLQVSTFDGKIKDAINSYLEKSDRYVSEELSLKRETGGIKPSKTSEDTKETINKIAEENGIAQALHFDILRHQTDDMAKLESVKDEYENVMAVNEYSNKQFYKYVSQELQFDEELEYMLLNYDNLLDTQKQFISKIEEIGLDRYKQVVTNYNEGIEKLKDEGKLPTSQEIVNSIKENKEIDLTQMIKNEKQVLKSTTELGQETLVEQKDTDRKDKVEKDINEQTRNLQESKLQEEK